MKPVRFIVVVHTDRADNVIVESFVYYDTAKLYYDQIGQANIDSKAMYDAHSAMKVLHSFDTMKQRGRDEEGGRTVDGERIVHY